MYYVIYIAMCLIGLFAAMFAGMFIGSIYSKPVDYVIPGIIGLIVAGGICWFSFSNEMYWTGALILFGAVKGFLEEV